MIRKLQDFFIFLSIISIFFFPFNVIESSNKAYALYNSLDPLSISQHLALYELYPNELAGKNALKHAWFLLTGEENSSVSLESRVLDEKILHSLVSLLNKSSHSQILELEDSILEIIERLANRLPNRLLKGNLAITEREVFNLAPEEIDLARALFLSQLGDHCLKKIRSYEAMLDLMALQIQAKLPFDASIETKIRTMNDFIFYEMGFRFPPHSLYSKDIDVYTFLPSVLDSKRGVCLGVSILYICLAQRLNLSLEMITPPGHIYIRYKDEKNIINIETTARGIHIDCSEYLTVTTKHLQQRNIKEVIGLAHFNQASTFWRQQKYQEALTCYKKALPYLPNDKLLQELMGYTSLFVGETEQGNTLLKELKNYTPDHAVGKETTIEDYFEGHTDIEGLKALYMEAENTRESLLEKRLLLETIIKKQPKFKSGLFALASCWLQLHRHGEALKILEQYSALDNNNPSVEYYLTLLYMSRVDFNKAWKHLYQLEKILHLAKHQSKHSKELRKQLQGLSPNI